MGTISFEQHVKLLVNFLHFFFQSRLIDLDTTDDFLAMARKLYPQVDHKIISDLERDYRSTDFVNSKRPRPAHSNHGVDQPLQQADSNAVEVPYSTDSNEIQIKGDEYL